MGKKKFLAFGLLTVFGILALTGCGSEKAATTNQDKVLNVYSTRHYDVDKEVYEAFEKETGIKVNVVEGKDAELLERLKREKNDPHADVFLAVGANTIYPLKEDKLLQPISSKTIESNIPANFRGEGWTGLLYRARVIAYEKGKFDPSQIKTYNDLTKPEFRGKILVRNSSSAYNVGLLASFIEEHGAQWANDWAKGIVANLARKPEGNDRDQAKEVVAGVGDLAIMNSYYYVRMVNSSDPKEQEVAKKIGLIFPEKTHINISYAALLNGSKHKENAVKFIEYLTSEKVQKIYAENNGEFAINPKVPKTEIQKSWGDFTIQNIDLSTMGKYAPEAAKIFDMVGWK